MGWKVNCILINEREDGFLGTQPPHDTQRAIQLARQLGLGRVKPAQGQKSWFNLYPERLIIGAYQGAAAIALPRPDDTGRNLVRHPGSPNPLLSVAAYFDPRSPQTVRLLSAFPEARILCLMLQSVVSMFGYALYEHGRLRRARIGDDDAGVFVDEGALLMEEEPLFSRSIIREGQRYFIGPDGDESTEAAYGEEFVFELARPFFGTTLDDDVPEQLAVEEFERVRWWPF
jgi:hypothetical protein